MEAHTKFPEYGVGGDYPGARRRRRAFILCVLSVVVLTGALWFAENYLQYEHTEMLYRSALTLPIESARPVLIQAIAIDERRNEFPTPKYVGALATRQEGADALETYQRAHALDPGNVSLAIRYGCRLLAHGRVSEASARFQEAAKKAPENALPAFLEAATHFWEGSDPAGLNKSMAILARTNHGAEVVEFPEPLWFPGTPKSGAWYAYLQRRIVDECLAPLYHYSARVIEYADSQLEASKGQYVNTWMTTIGEMADMLVHKSRPRGTMPVIAGIQFQLDALERMAKVQRVGDGEPDEELAVARANYSRAMERLMEFEQTRDETIESRRQEYTLPLSLVAKGLGLCFAFYCVAWCAAMVFREGAADWTLEHSRWGKWLLAGGNAGLLAVLLLIAVFQGSSMPANTWIPVSQYTWWTIVGILLVFGLAYPSFVLPAAEEVAKRHGHPETQRELIPLARRYRRHAYVALSRRYYGIVVGLLISTACLWIILYRVANTLYPWQINLLTSGLKADELRAVEAVLSLLA